jgi:hypothetical protein
MLSSSDLESACPVSLLESLMLSGMGLLCKTSEGLYGST